MSKKKDRLKNLSKIIIGDNSNLPLGSIIHSNKWKISEDRKKLNYLAERVKGDQKYFNIAKVTEEERKTYELTYDPERKILLDNQGNPANTKGKNAKRLSDTAIFVMLKAPITFIKNANTGETVKKLGTERIFITEQDHTSEYAQERGLMTHAALSGGKIIEAAGSIQIDDGKITKIISNSGHYRSDIYDIYRAVKILNDKGLFKGVSEGVGPEVGFFEKSKYDNTLVERELSVDKFLYKCESENLKEQRINTHKEEKDKLMNVNVFNISGEHQNLADAINSIFPSPSEIIRDKKLLPNYKEDKVKELSDLKQMIQNAPKLCIKFFNKSTRKEEKYGIKQVVEYLESNQQDDIENDEFYKALRHLEVLGLKERKVQSAYLADSYPSDKEMEDQNEATISYPSDKEMEDQNEATISYSSDKEMEDQNEAITIESEEKKSTINTTHKNNNQNNAIRIIRKVTENDIHGIIDLVNEKSPNQGSKIRNKVFYKNGKGQMGKSRKFSNKYFSQSIE